MWFSSPQKLKKLGVLGMNSRNIEYIARYNERHLYPLVDNKLNTKRAAQRAGVAVPELLGVIENQWQLRKLPRILDSLQRFVIKPTRGSGGKGILVIDSRNGKEFVKPSGQELDIRAVRRHVNNILSGLYSLGGKPDSAMVETMIDFDPLLENYTYEGVPDIRVIIFKGFPVMAMLRCSTHASDGRANLHQGAIGVGLDVVTGKTLYALQHNRPITEHPDTQQPFADLQIPGWSSLLCLAAGCFEMTGLGYLGCDIVLDREKGPVILELNARPGLAIQMATGCGLEKVLRHIETLEIEQLEQPPEERVAYSQALLLEI